ncbi:hypothetical protein, conserved [Leishmania shawi]|uniref:Ig-like domain-containing protein n=1 Tax=Leishmania shawi TaxID=5680 RepID=A0ABR3E4H9_9TRYP
MNHDDTTGVPTSAAIADSSTCATVPGGMAQTRMLSRLRVAGSTGIRRVNEASEAPLAPLPSARPLGRDASTTGDVAQYGGCASLVRTATAAAVVAVENAVPQSSAFGCGDGRDDDAVLRKEENSCIEVDVGAVNASSPLLGQPTSGAAQHLSYDAANDGTGGRLQSRGGNAAAVDIPLRCRATWTRQTTPEPLQGDGGLLCAAAALNSSTTSNADDKTSPQSAAAAATATDVLESPAAPPPSPKGEHGSCDYTGNPLHLPGHHRHYIDMDLPGMGESNEPWSGSVASSASSAPHSTAETQWHNTSVASELDLYEMPLPVMETATGDLTAAPSVTASFLFGGVALPVAFSVKSGGSALTADRDAKVWSPISVSATVSPSRRNIAGLKQPADLSGWRRKRSSGKLAAQSERNNSSSGPGDIPLVSLEKSVGWSAGKPMNDDSLSPVTSLSQQRGELLERSVYPLTSTQVTTATTLATVESGTASNPFSSHSSLRSFDSHHALQRSALIARMSVPCQGRAPSLQLSAIVRPGGAVLESANLGTPVRSPQGMSTSLGLPMFVGGSTGSPILFSKYDTVFPLRMAPRTHTKLAGDESQQSPPRLHDQRNEGDADQPPPTPTAALVTQAAQQQQQQQTPFCCPQHGETDAPECSPLTSLSALPQQSLRSSTVTSDTSFGVDNAISMRQCSMMSEDHILQTLVHGMALGGVSAEAWMAAPDNWAPSPRNLRSTGPGNRHLTGRLCALQRPLSPSSRSAASDAVGAGSGKTPTAGLVASSMRFSQLQTQRGKLGWMSSTRPAGPWGAELVQGLSPVSASAANRGDETAETGSHLLTCDPLTVAPSSPSKRHMAAHTPTRLQQQRKLPSPENFFAKADGSLRDSVGFSATSLPTLSDPALHARRSLVTPMQGYSFKQHPTAASMASSALSQVPLGVEEVIFSAGSTPNVVGCVEASVATWLPVASTDTAARQLSGDQTVVLRPYDSSAAYYRISNGGLFSTADSGVTVAAPREASLEGRLTFLQSVHDLDSFAAQAEASASLGYGAAVQSPLTREIVEPGAVATTMVSPPSSIAPVDETFSVCRPPPPAPAMLLRHSPTRRPFYLIPGLEAAATAELGRISPSPFTVAPWAIGGASDFVAAVATPLLPGMLSEKDKVSPWSSDSTRGGFLQVLPLAQEEHVSTSLSYKVRAPKTTSPMSASQAQDDSVAVTDPQLLWWAPKAAHAAAPFTATDTDTHPASVHRNSDESGTHSSMPNFSCRSPPVHLPPQQQTPPQLQVCAPAAMWSFLYGVHNNDDQGAYQIATFNSNPSVALTRSSTRVLSSCIVDQAADVWPGGEEEYRQSCRPEGEMLFRRPGTLTGSISQCRRSGKRRGGGPGAPLRISIPCYQRYRDVEALLDDAERAMNRTSVPIISLLSYGGRSLNGDEYSPETLGNGLASSVMSLATPALMTSMTCLEVSLVSPLALESASDKPVASPTGTMSFSVSPPRRR